MGRIPPEFLKDPNYDPNRFPRAFEDALLMVLKPNHLYAERINLHDPYEVDFAIQQTSNKETLFYAEAEYDASGKVFTKDGQIAYDRLNILSRKKKYFLKDKPTVFVKGNLQFIFVLDTNYVLKFGVEKTILCSFRKYKETIKTASDYLKNVKFLDDRVFQINTKHAIESGVLLFGSLQNWIQYVKQIHRLGGLQL